MGVYVEGMGWRVGPSSYADLKGVEQYCALERHADQLNSLAFEFDERPESKAAGIRLSVNEAIRSDARQYEFWDDWQHYLKYGTPWAALAAKPLTSRHRKALGTAFDLGITEPDGENRAPTAEEWAWIHARAALRGIRHTGAGFIPREEWHHDAGYPETLAPIPGVRIANTPIPITVDTSPEEDDDMKPRFLRVNAPGNPKHGLVGYQWLPIKTIDTKDEAEIIEIGRVSGVLPFPMPEGRTWANYVEDVSLAEYQRGVAIARETRADQSRGVWLFQVDPDGKRTAQQFLLALPRLVWAHVFRTNRTAGDTLANVVAPKLTQLVPDEQPTTTKES